MSVSFFRDQFCAWVETLPEKQSPAWLGLPNNAETILLTQHAKELVNKMMRMQQLDDDEPVDLHVGAKTGGGAKAVVGDVRPAWMRALSESVDGWLRSLPDKLPLLRRTAEGLKDPLFRFFEREVRLGSVILARVRADLCELREICHAQRKQTNQHREIGQQLVKGVLPSSWRRYSVPATITVSAWVGDLAQRLAQLQEVIAAAKGGGPASLRGGDYWIGGLFNPDAFITATRQCVAQANFWSLEDLKLKLSLSGGSGGKDGMTFGIKSLHMYGAHCERDLLRISRSSLTELKHVRLQWHLKKSKEEEEEKEHDRQQSITLPVYLNSERSEILVNVQFDLEQGQEETVFVETGVAFMANL